MGINCVLHPSRSPFPVLCMQALMCCPYLAFHMSLEQTLIFWLVNRTGFVHQKCQHFVAKLWWQDSGLLFLGFLPTSYPYIPGHLGRETTRPSSPHRRESLWCGSLSGEYYLTLCPQSRICSQQNLLAGTTHPGTVLSGSATLAKRACVAMGTAPSSIQLIHPVLFHLPFK